MFIVNTKKGMLVKVSADDFFTRPTGEYKFDPALLGKAHAECMRAFIASCQYAEEFFIKRGIATARVVILRGIPGSGKTTYAIQRLVDDAEKEVVICVDNTNINATDISAYASVAMAYGIKPKIITFRCDHVLATRRCLHGVPADRVEQMAKYLDLETARLPPFWEHQLIQV